MLLKIIICKEIIAGCTNMFNKRMFIWYKLFLGVLNEISIDNQDWELVIYHIVCLKASVKYGKENIIVILLQILDS